MVTESMLTTVDNPHDPFDDFRAWYAYDERMAHHTTSFLARVTFSSGEISEADQRAAMEAAIDEIVAENINGMYKKVTREIET